MKIDYELVNKIGATHYCDKTYRLYKVSAMTLLVYIDDDWKLCLAGVAALNHIKPIPPKPRTRTEYEKVTESIFDLRDEFERGELFMKGRGAGGDFFNKITTEYELVTFASRGLYRKVEKEIDWTADVMDFLGNELQRGERVKHADVELFCDGSKFINLDVSLPKDRFLELCRVTLRANGELD